MSNSLSLCSFVLFDPLPDFLDVASLLAEWVGLVIDSRDGGEFEGGVCEPSPQQLLRFFVVEGGKGRDLGIIAEVSELGGRGGRAGARSEGFFGDES